MAEDFEAWVIYAESPGKAARSTDDPLFPWGWGEAIAVLPPETSREGRTAAVAAIAQVTHFADGDRSDALQFADRTSYFYEMASNEYFSALHPYLTISRATNIRYVEPKAGDARGRIEFDRLPRG